MTQDSVAPRAKKIAEYSLYRALLFAKASHFRISFLKPVVSSVFLPAVPGTSTRNQLQT